MKFIPYITLVFLLFSTSLLAQENGTIKAIVSYAFSHLEDTTKGAKVYTENMNLFLSANSSWYKTADKAMADSIMAANFKATGNKVLNLIPYSNEELFLNFADHKLLIKEKFFDDYLMEDDWPTINWQITNETSTISGLNCQKAIGEWRGRTYTAWFSSELPYHAGPWKLNGLPGLIIEAYDTNKEVVFKFAGFHTIKDSNEMIEVPTKVIKTTIKEYSQMRIAFHQDRAGFINNVTGKKTIISTTKELDSSKGLTNPLELSAN